MFLLRPETSMGYLATFAIETTELLCSANAIDRILIVLHYRP